MESKRMIAVSLAKLQGFRTQRGGMRLHRGLLVSYVLRNAKQAYLGEKYRQLCEYQQYQQQQQQEEDMRQLKQQQQQQQWTCGDRSPMTSICSHPALPAAETTALATIIVTEKPVEVSTSDLATTITTTTTTLATELPDPSARLCRKRSSSEEGTDDDEGSPPKRPRIQQQHQQQNFQQQEQKPSPPREVSTNKKGPHIVRYHPQPLGQLSLNCMAVAAC
ncbi:unnamed protein product [Lampetra fluviatilis]